MGVPGNMTTCSPNHNKTIIFHEWKSIFSIENGIHLITGTILCLWNAHLVQEPFHDYEMCIFYRNHFMRMRCASFTKSMSCLWDAYILPEPFHAYEMHIFYLNHFMLIRYIFKFSHFIKYLWWLGGNYDYL